MINQEKILEIQELLETFTSGRDRSLGLAGRLEVALDDVFPEDERFEDLVLALASYRPGGGDYLYDAEAILPMAYRALSILRS
ncbi:MAG: hypothetical protein QOF89_5004 [Acidobacteriota bacterium]|jgi:hypothetical protein|nr:hypothetical protein [Acidobacteriota bacterium]